MNPNGLPLNIMRGQPMGFMGMPNGQMPQQHPQQQQMQQAQLQQQVQQQQQQAAQMRLQQQNLYNQLDRQLQQALSSLPPGWKQSLPLIERRGYILEMASALKALKPDLNQGQAYTQAMKTEQLYITQSPDQGSYMSQIKTFIMQLRAEREKNAQRVGMGMGMGMGMGNIQAQNQPGPPNQGQDMRPSMSNNGQPIPPSFNPQLRGPMQASPIPVSAQSNAVNPGSLAAVAPQMQQQMSQGMPPQGQHPPSAAQIQQLVSQNAQRLMQNHKPEHMGMIMQKWNQLPVEQRTSFLKMQPNSALAPLQWYYGTEARQLVSAQLAQQRGGQGARMQPNMGANGMMAGPGGQQNMQQMMNNQQRMNGAFPNTDMDFSQFLGQQQDAIQSANSGQTVVPASNNPPLSQPLGNMGMMMGQNNNFAGQPQPGQMPGAGMGGRPQGINPQANQMQAQVLQAQNNQRLAQQMQNRPQAMNMAGQMSSQPGMSLLTQAVGQNQGVPSRPQSTQGVNPGQNMMNAMGQNNAQQQPGQAQQQQQQHAPAGAGGPNGMMQQNRPGQAGPQGSMPEHVRQMIAQQQQQQQNMARLGQQQGQMPPNQSQPGMMGQPGPNRMQQNGAALPSGMTPNASMNPQSLQRSIPPHIMQQLDLREFPQSFLQANNIPPLPPQIRTWGQLKSWLMQNKQAVPNLDMGRVLMAQITSHKNNNAQNAPNGMSGLANNMQPGQAPMLGQMGANMNSQMANARLQVTSAEIQVLRDHLQRSGQHRSEEEIRNVILAKKQSNLAAMMQQHKANAINNAMMAGGQPGARPNMGQPGPPMQQNMPNAAQAAQMMKTPQAPQAAPAQSSQPSAPNMRKRPSNDGAESRATAPSRAQTPQINNKAQGRTAVTTPQNQAMAAIANQSASPATNALVNRMGIILKQVRATFKIPDRKPPITTQQRMQYMELLRNNLEAARTIDAAMKFLYMSRQNDDELRLWFRDRFLLHAQVDPKEGKLNDAIFLSLDEFRNLLIRVSAMVNQFQRMKPGVAASSQQQKPKQENEAAAVSQSPKTSRGSVSAMRNNSKAPPAPTAGPGQKSFFPSGVQSPQGVPTYLGPSAPVPDIKMPPSKKQKRQPSISVASPQTTAASASPQVGKPVADTKATPTVKPMEPPRAKPFKCEEVSCEYHTAGFDTKVEMEEHKKVHFVFPADPIKYAEESLAAALGLNPDGSEKITLEAKDNAPSTPSTAKAAAMTSPSIASLKGAKDTKLPAPTSAPKAESKAVQAIKFEDDTNSAVISPMVMNDIFDIEALTSLDFPSLPSTLDSSPSALTPSSSRGSSSSGALEKTADILDQDKLKVQIAVDGSIPTFGDDKDTMMLSLEDFTTELANSDFSSLGIFPTTFDDDAPTDPSHAMFTDQFTTDENGEKFLDLDPGDWTTSLGMTSDADFEKLLSST